MNTDGLIIILPIATFLIVIAFALWSKRGTEKKMEDPEAEKSSLAKDGPGQQPFR